MVVGAGAAMRSEEQEERSRESAHPAATPEPDERKLGAVDCKDTKQGGDWQTGPPKSRCPSLEQCVPGTQSRTVDGWVAAYL